MSDQLPPPMSRRELHERERRAGTVSRPAPRVVRAAFVPPVAPKPPARGRARRAVVSGAALLFAGALALSVTMPATIFSNAADAATGDAASLVADGQSVAAGGLENDDVITRSSFGASTQEEIDAEKFKQSSAGSGSTGSWTPTTGSVRWPFPYSVGISSGFGPRKAPMPGVSSFHKGIDFTPGEGAPTFSIADGTVTMASLSPYGLGNEVIIESEINGQRITSLFGHMEMNSIVVKVGQKVKAGDMVGKTGSTGTVTGANMHLEIHVNDVPVDPYSWLQKNATD